MSFSDLELEFLSKCPYFIGQQYSGLQVIANVQSELNNAGSHLQGIAQVGRNERNNPHM